ncbi:MAG: DUF2723 domain-containing protein [Bacteroidales bacterium]|nr:DUF2723 domain-containing protein [Bacteroidales bacterium]
MKNYKLVNTLMGWVAFLAAAITYGLTIEPTASFWDCPEFILSAYKLEVGHPPGAPFYMLMGNVVSQLVGDTHLVAASINMMNAILSALCILFLFWTITHLALRLVAPDFKSKGITTAQAIVVQGAGLVGALAYTWSDTFWFSAVEGEVYAFSSLFTAAVFWMILKWEEQADEPQADRWIILIAYCVGVSIGVHLLNLLCVPALVLVYCYRRYPNAGVRQSLIALAVSFGLIIAVLYGIVPGIVKVGGWFELLFVNELGLGFNTGFVSYIFLTTAIVVWAIYESYVGLRRSRVVWTTLVATALLGIPFVMAGWLGIVLGGALLGGLYLLLHYQTDSRKGTYLVSFPTINTAVVALFTIMVGYASYAVIVIRSGANTPMDQNSPEDVFTLGPYLGREQYGTRPLFSGQAYNSMPEYVDAGNGMMAAKRTEGTPIYSRKDKADANEPDQYVKVGDNGDIVWEQTMLFPRMYSRDHASAYEAWMGGVKGTMKYSKMGQAVKIPTQGENLKFFLSYQINFMYWRYFMWNFAGRQNDIQSMGELEHGNWLTGIKAFDNMRLGDQSLLPDSLKANKGHNVFYALPLLLGLLGFFWQAFRNKTGIQQFWVVFFLFFMTGLAIVLYINQTPQQPRERDYSYAGSFYAFAIWIGLGVPALASLLKRWKLREAPAAIVAVVLGLVVPIQMVSQTWDDHDRSGRFVASDFGSNYLESMAQEGNPLIFCNGDNDTFPLWYGQEVEGKRTDARVCNLSYLQTDWYIDQMKRPAYTSPAMPISWQRLQYNDLKRQSFPIRPDGKAQLVQLAQAQGQPHPFDVKYILSMLRDGQLNVIPTDTLTLQVDAEAVRRSGMLLVDSVIPEQMVISLAGRQHLTLAQVMMLEMLANTNWERPLYTAVTVGGNVLFGLEKYFVREGIAYRITPFANANGRVDTKRMYENVMNRFRYGGLDKGTVYLDETAMRMCWTHRSAMTTLANALLEEGDTKRATEVLEKSEIVLPVHNLPHTFMSGSYDMAKAWATLGQKAKAEAIYNELIRESEQLLAFYASLGQARANNFSTSIMQQLAMLDHIMRGAQAHTPEVAKRAENILLNYSQTFNSILQHTNQNF